MGETPEAGRTWTTGGSRRPLGLEAGKRILKEIVGQDEDPSARVLIMRAAVATTQVRRPILSGSSGVEITSECEKGGPKKHDHLGTLVTCRILGGRQRKPW